MNLIQQIKAAIESAPKESDIGVSAEKLRARRPRKSCITAYQKAHEARDKVLAIACEMSSRGVDKITLSDGRTTVTVWNTRENLTALFKRLAPAFPKA